MFFPKKSIPDKTITDISVGCGRLVLVVVLAILLAISVANWGG